MEPDGRAEPQSSWTAKLKPGCEPRAPSFPASDQDVAPRATVRAQKAIMTEPTVTHPLTSAHLPITFTHPQWPSHVHNVDDHVHNQGHKQKHTRSHSTITTKLTLTITFAFATMAD